jgi:RNA polymerase sigma-70 factor, ECF subfamily
MLPYHTGVLEGGPTGPDLALIPGRGGVGRDTAPFSPPAGNIIEGDPVGAAGEAHEGGEVTRGHKSHRGGEVHGGHHQVYERQEGQKLHGGHEVHWGQRADADAAEELFKDTYPQLAGWVRRLVDDDDTAHEIASEAFVRLLSRWTRVGSPQSYLYMIATNLTRDHWRKAERERRAIRSVTAGAAVDPVAYPAQDVDVRNLIASLPPRLREPFLLHHYGGFGVREVAALLRKPEGTIKADLFAARARLKTALGDRDG